MNTITADQLQAARILVVGDMMLDRYWFGEVERISPEAPVPVVQIQRAEERLGGAANVARNVATLHAQVSMLGVIGDDEAGHSIEALLHAGGISAHLQRDPVRNTTVKLRVLGRQQQLIRVDFENPPTPEALAGVSTRYAELVATHDLVVLSDYGKGGLAHVTDMIDIAKRAGKRVLVDPKGDDYARYWGATLLTPNQAELRQVVGRWHSEADLIFRAQSLRRDLNLEALLLTRSEEGMTLFTAHEVLHVQAQAREVYDVTGAGDTVVATLAALLAAGVSVAEAVHHANRAGAIVVGKLGTAAVTYAELFATAPSA